MRSKIVLYAGHRGAGKTLTMVKDGYQYFSAGFDVYANFVTPFTKYLSVESLLATDITSNLRDCVLLIDEIQVMFDSRAFGSKVNQSFSHFIQQIRKRGIIILATTQFLTTIDKRLRQNLDVVAEPFYFQDLAYCLVKYYDLSVIQSLEYDFDDLPYVSVVFDAREVFPLYKTTELIG